MRQEVLTVKVNPEVMRDLDEFASAECIQPCLSCQGLGQRNGKRCPTCAGRGTSGSRSEAARVLLHFALGNRASPEMRAMLAAYSEYRSRFMAMISKTASRMEKGFHDEVVSAVRGSGIDGR